MDTVWQYFLIKLYNIETLWPKQRMYHNPKISPPMILISAILALVLNYNIMNDI